MSHNLSQNAQGQHEMFVAGVPAWHNLGQNVEKAQTWEQAVELAKLDWTISKLQLTNPRTSALIPSYALVRDDDGRWLSTVGEKYFPVQNRMAFSFVDALLKTGDAHYVSAGALGNGEVMWCLAALDKMNFAPVKGDEHKPYLLFVDFRSFRSAQIRLCVNRVVCNNTLNMALSEKAAEGEVIKLRHTVGIEDKLETAKKLLKSVDGELMSMKDRLRALVSKKITQPQFMTIMEKLFPGFEKKANAEAKAAVVASNFMTNDQGKVKGIEGSAYALLQACTQWIDHQRDGFKNTEGTTTEAKRAESAMFGTGDKFKLHALSTISQVVGVDDIDEILADAALSATAE